MSRIDDPSYYPLDGDASFTDICFRDKIIPILREAPLNWQFFHNVKFGSLKDIDSCIDAECGRTLSESQPIQYRFQAVPKSYDTFTIRRSRASGRETEYAKLKRLIPNGLGPKLMLQGYVSSKNLRSEDFAVHNLALAKMVDVLSYIAQGKYEIRNTFNQGRSSFYCVSWVSMAKDHKLMWLYRDIPSLLEDRLVERAIALNLNSRELVEEITIKKLYKLED